MSESPERDATNLSLMTYRCANKLSSTRLSIEVASFIAWSCFVCRIVTLREARRGLVRREVASVTLSFFCEASYLLILVLFTGLVPFFHLLLRVLDVAFFVCRLLTLNS